MIDFEKTREAIASHRSNLSLDHGSEHQVTDQMLGVCNDVLAGRYQFNEDSADAFGRSFIAWTKARKLLVFS